MKRSAVLIVLLLALTGCGKPEPPPDYRPAILSHMVNATVQLLTERADAKSRSGSAVTLLVDRTDGHVLLLTAAHLLTPEIEQKVYAIDPLTGERLDAEVVAVDSRIDLAVLRTDSLRVEPVRFMRENQLGDQVWVTAFPWGRERTVVNGFVSQIEWHGNGTYDKVPIKGPVRLIDASVSYGMSGGGVFHRETGALVGVVRGYRTAELVFPGSDAGPLRLPVAGETTVVPANDILCFLRQADADDSGIERRLPAALGDCDV